MVLWPVAATKKCALINCCLRGDQVQFGADPGILHAAATFSPWCKKLSKAVHLDISTASKPSWYPGGEQRVLRSATRLLKTSSIVVEPEITSPGLIAAMVSN
jgi:hypothetical protein